MKRQRVIKGDGPVRDDTGKTCPLPGHPRQWWQFETQGATNFTTQQGSVLVRGDFRSGRCPCQLVQQARQGTLLREARTLIPSAVSLPGWRLLHLRSIVANQYSKSLFAGLPRLPWSSQCRAGESQRVQRQQHTP